MAINIPDPTKGRKTPLASPITTGAQAGFGQAVGPVQKIAMAPEKAFGDASGQIAMANALMNVGNDFFSIMKREGALMQAEDDANIKRMENELNHTESKIRIELEEEQATSFRDADTKLEEYNKRVELAQNEARGKYQFKTMSEEAVEGRFTKLVEDRQLNYRSGKYIMNFRAQEVKAQYDQSMESYKSQAVIAGQENQPGQVASILNEIANVTASDQYIAAHGSVAAADLKNQEASQKVVEGFLGEYIEKYPVDSLRLIESVDSVGAWLGLEDEQAASMFERLRKVAEPARQAVISNTSASMDHDLDMIEYGLTDEPINISKYANVLQYADPLQKNSGSWKKLEKLQIQQHNQTLLREYSQQSTPEQWSDLRALETVNRQDRSLQQAMLAQSMRKSYTKRLEVESKGNGLDHFASTQRDVLPIVPIMQSKPEQIKQRVKTWRAYNSVQDTSTERNSAMPLIDTDEVRLMVRQGSKSGRSPDQIGEEIELLFVKSFGGPQKLLTAKELEVQKRKLRGISMRVDPSVGQMVYATQKMKEVYQAGIKAQEKYFPVPQGGK